MNRDTFCVYILTNTEEKYYIGHTNCIEKRLSQHNDRERMSWASKRGPWSVIYVEKCSSRAESMKKEKYFKSFKNKETLRRYILAKKNYL